VNGLVSYLLIINNGLVYIYIYIYMRTNGFEARGTERDIYGRPNSLLDDQRQGN
jgi:hypothetical protein